MTMDKDQVDRLVDAVTGEIMKRLGEAGSKEAKPADKKSFLVLGKDPACPVAACLNRDFRAETGPNLDRVHDYDFVVMPVYYLDRLTGQKQTDGAAPVGNGVLDFTGRRLIHERELREKLSSAAKILRVDAHAMITSLAQDYIKKRGLTVERV